MVGICQPRLGTDCSIFEEGLCQNSWAVESDLRSSLEDYFDLRERKSDGGG